MGRKKKPFIDKKDAIKFNLVHRSQKDPLIDRPDLGQMVLAEDAREERLQEQRKYGIYFDDDYSYLQHLKEPSSLGPPTSDADDNTVATVLLPAVVFGNEITTNVDRVVPVKGPQPDWDPDIIKALDEEDSSNDGEDQLEDDFIAIANKQDNKRPVEREPLEPWWLHRGDYGARPLSHDISHDHSDDEGSDSILLNDKKSTRFTEYSLSSAVVPRNEGLSLLDERFEEFMIEYDDDQIGPLNECENGRSDHQRLAAAIDQFVITEQSKTTKLADITKEKMRVQDEEGSEEDVGEDAEKDIVKLERKAKVEWDCESILSTYSNLYNHPTLIKEHVNQQRKKPNKSDSTDESSLTNETDLITAVLPQASTIRPKHETAEEKRERKEAIKAERRMRRINKKANRELFKKEQIKIEKQLINNPRTTSLL